jgi:hypothetical protein
LSIAKPCCSEGIHQANYYKWSKDFIEEDKYRLKGDISEFEKLKD